MVDASDDIDTGDNYLPVSNQTLTWSDVFEVECENAIQFGLTYSEYWNGELDMLWYYAKNYCVKKRNEFEAEDRRAWMNGYYNYYAHAITLANAFSKKGTKPIPYFDKPQFTLEDEASKKEREQRKVKNEELKFLSIVRNLGVAVEDEATS